MLGNLSHTTQFFGDRDRGKVYNCNFFMQESENL